MHAPPPAAAAVNPYQLPGAGGLNPSQLNTSQPLPAPEPNGAADSVADAGVKMEGVEGGEGVIAEGKEGEGEGVSRKELDQQEQDLDLGELFDQMDDWKPIVSRLSITPGRGSRCS